MFQKGSMTRSNVPGWRTGVPPKRRLKRLKPAHDDDVDHAVGVVCLRKRGDRVAAGEPLAQVHARDDASGREAVSEVAAAYAIADEQPAPRPLILDVLS